MFLRLESAVAGFDFVGEPGQIFDWQDPGEAERLVSRGMATELTESGAILLSRSENKPIRVRKAERRKIEKEIASEGPSKINQLADVFPKTRKL
jgi:hypothetical protein